MNLTRRTCISALACSVLPGLQAQGQTGAPAVVDEVWLDAERRRDLPVNHALVASITTDWWRATLLVDAAAGTHLTAPQGLNPGDSWQQK
jgi:hypothetical protein